MLIDTESLIKKLEKWIEGNPEPSYPYDNEALRIIIHAENKLCRKFIRFLESLG